MWCFISQVVSICILDCFDFSILNQSIEEKRETYVPIRRFESSSAGGAESRERDSGILEAEVEHRTDSMGQPGLVVHLRTSKRKTSFAFSCIDRSVSSDSMYMDDGIVRDSNKSAR